MKHSLEINFGHPSTMPMSGLLMHGIGRAKKAVV